MTVAQTHATSNHPLPKSNDALEAVWAMANDDSLDAKLRLDALKAILAHQEKQCKKAKVQRDAATAELGSDWEAMLPEHPAFADFGKP